VIAPRRISGAGHQMSSLGSTAAAVLIAAGLASAWTQTVAKRNGNDGPALPVAALAWARVNCDASLALRPGTPRVQAEDLFRVAAKYDAERSAHGPARACWLAQRAAYSVTEGIKFSPAERLLSVFASLH
jgi:hypothetical protein